MGDTEEDILLRGVVRVENVENPEQYVAAVMRKVRKHHLDRTYDVKGWDTPTEFLEALARKGGRLLKGGEADLDGVAKMVLNDFLRGKIPWFTPPPENNNATAVDASKPLGLLDDTSRKRRRDENDKDNGTESKRSKAINGEAIPITASEDDEFEGVDEGEDQNGTEEEDDEIDDSDDVDDADDNDDE